MPGRIVSDCWRSPFHPDGGLPAFYVGERRIGPATGWGAQDGEQHGRERCRFVTTKTVAERARVKPVVTVAVLDAAPAVVESLGLPGDARFVAPDKAQLLFLFVSTRAELDARMPAAVASLAPGAALWVFFRKGSRTAMLDMNRDDVWAVAERLGMSPLGLISVDETWSAFRLRRAT